MLDVAPSTLTGVGWLSLLVLLAALGSGLIAGVFFAFSAFIMKALAALPSREGIRSMQSINVIVLNPVFLSVFAGTALISLLLLIYSIAAWAENATAHLLSAGILYLGGSFFVTISGNVPLNNRLAAVQPDSAAGADMWSLYLRRWVSWNHVRTIASLASCAGFILALREL